MKHDEAGLGFAHLRVKTDYTLFSSLIQAEELPKRAKALGVGCVAVADRWTMAAIPEFCWAAKQADVKPIVGLEVDVLSEGESPERRLRGTLTLLAKDRTGYENLCRLLAMFEPAHASSSEAIPISGLAGSGLCEGLVGITGSGDGVIAQLLAQGRHEEAEGTARALAKAFGEGDFYLGIGTAAIGDAEHVEEAICVADAQAAILARTLGLRGPCGLKIVAADSVQHFERNDYSDLVVWHKGSTAGSIPEGEMHYLKSPDEARLDFSDYPDAVASTLEIARNCNFTLETVPAAIPRSPLIQEGETAEAALERICKARLAQRYGSSVPDGARERLAMELGHICNAEGYAACLLIVAEYVMWAREQGIAVGFGRGACAASIVNYVLGIAGVDPMRHGLLFEMIGRNDTGLPDIDTDFEIAGRERVLRHIVETYGADSVAHLGIYQRKWARLAFAHACDIVEAEGESVAEARRAVAAAAPYLEKNLAQVLATDGRFRDAWYSDRQVRLAFDRALSFEGTVCDVGTHACGIALCDGKITDRMPLGLDPERRFLQIQYESYYVEKYGVVKLDLLGLSSLDIVAQCKSLLASSGVQVQEPDYPGEAVAALRQLIDDDDLEHVYMLDELSPLPKDMLKKARLSSIDDVAAWMALNRREAYKLGFVEQFVSGSPAGVSQHADVLADSRGMIVYNEQIVRILAREHSVGIPEAWGLFEEMRDRCREAPSDEIDELNPIERATLISCRKPHVLCYAYLTLLMAWLKATYPAEFAEAVAITEKMTWHF